NAIRPVVVVRCIGEPLARGALRARPRLRGVRGPKRRRGMRRNSMRYRNSIVAALVALAAIPLAAQTLYKLIDKNGKVTYVDTPPKNFDGQVIPVEIDTKRNSATITTPGTAGAVRSFDEKIKAEDRAAERRKAAQERL